VIQNYERYYNSIISQTSQEIIDIDTLIAVIGEAVGKMYENEDDEEIQPSLNQEQEQEQEQEQIQESQVDDEPDIGKLTLNDSEANVSS